jgi:D-cysteine desulfhydrase
VIPRIRFAHLPTPIEELHRLSAHLGGPRVFVKRDDQTGLAFGGNKTRKLEFLIAEAQEQNANVLITGGAIQSNHCRQTAAAAARFGLGCVLVLTGRRPASKTGNLLLDDFFGADIVYVEDRADRDTVLQQTYQREASAGRRPYLVPYGGSSATGALGYAFAVEELMAQMPDADWIVFATSSGGTHAGLTAGKAVFGFRGRVLGISIDESVSWLKATVPDLATSAAKKMGHEVRFSPDDVFATDDYCQAGYGVVTEVEREATRLFAGKEGLLLDPVYTGRAAGALMDLIRKGFFDKKATVLFWHTGGQPALFAEQYAGAI